MSARLSTNARRRPERSRIGSPGADVARASGSGRSAETCSAWLHSTETWSTPSPTPSRTSDRAIARWAARRAYDLAGLSSVAWIFPALAALEREEELPPPFDDQARVWQLLFTDPNVPQTAVSPPGGGPRNASQQAMAVPALSGSAERIRCRAAIHALYAAAVSYGDEWPSLFDDLRQAFPASRRPG